MLYAARKTGMQGLQQAISSGWVRGAVTGLGIVNLSIAVWEAFHFRQTVRVLEGVRERVGPGDAKTTESSQSSSQLPDHIRRDNESHNSGE
ncbi:MAG: hypothetical protein WKF84_00035 [Pyrinomonadaceae bacterium]